MLFSEIDKMILSENENVKASSALAKEVKIMLRRKKLKDIHILFIIVASYNDILLKGSILPYAVE